MFALLICAFDKTWQLPQEIQWKAQHIKMYVFFWTWGRFIFKKASESVYFVNQQERSMHETFILLIYLGISYQDETMLEVFVGTYICTYVTHCKTNWLHDMPC